MQIRIAARPTRIIATLTALLVTAVCLAAEPGGHEEHGRHTAASQPAAPATQETAGVPGAPVVTHHTLKIGAENLNYTVTAGYLPVETETGKVQGNIFFIAYTKEGVPDIAERPVTFAFNGGPGAASVWLHLGALGPKRVLLPGNGTELPATYRLVDNDQTWLDFTDLVFIDPIGTGYSRAADGVDPKQFYTLSKDLEVAGHFIRQYTTTYGRWLSAKYVAGESYGTTRAAALANQLQSDAGLNLRGVMLISSVLSFQVFSYDEGNDVAFALALPTFAAAAAYHKKATPDRAKVEQWALNEYLAAMAKGDALSDQEQAAVVKTLASFTGLTEDYIRTNRLRVSAQRFTKELLRAEQRTVGLMDTRVVGVDFTPRGEYPHYDPAFFLATGPYVATVNDYLRRDFEFETTRPYTYLSEEANGSWKWMDRGQGYVYVADDLAAAMTRDANFRVFAAAGQYDLTTPYFGQKYAFDHMGLDPSRRGNLIFRTYPSGHQIYTDPASLKALHSDVAAFVKGEPGPQP